MASGTSSSATGFSAWFLAAPGARLRRVQRGRHIREMLDELGPDFRQVRAAAQHQAGHRSGRHHRQSWSSFRTTVTPFPFERLPDGHRRRTWG